ncbi:MAG: ATP-binding cassette domain-containing protein [Bacteroidetes bacterium]|nr:ATP-binding cassette domain-containing protein [Bacteroidota bacterium]
MNNIEFKHIDFGYTDKSIFTDLSLSIPLSGFGTALMGKSGIGKTTLIKLVIGMLRPSNGEITLPEQTVFSYIPQSPVLFEHLSIKENIEYLKHSKEYAKYFESSRIDELVTLLGIQELLDINTSVEDLSGGQKQRVAICRALYQNADIIILDEPLTGLDQITKSKIMNSLVELCSTYGTHLLYITHHLEEAKYLCENILYFLQEDSSVKIDSINVKESKFPKHIEIAESIFYDNMAVLPYKNGDNVKDNIEYLCCYKNEIVFIDNGEYEITKVISTLSGYLIEIKDWQGSLLLPKQNFKKDLKKGMRFKHNGTYATYDKKGLIIE